MLMIMARHPSHILELAKRGAAARLHDLAQEARLLLHLFPHLRDAFDKDGLPISFLLAKGSGQLTKGTAVRRRRPMSAAARQAASQRMQKYWAARRNAKKA
jgi:hypothetical protein